MASASQPLKGKRVVITRASEQSAGLVEALEQLGAEVLSMPTVEFAPPEDTSPLDAAIARLSAFDWILFTSQNAVRFFAERARIGTKASATGGASRENSRVIVPKAGPQTVPETMSKTTPNPIPNATVKIGAVGPATAEAAIQEGFRVDYVATNHTGESLARELSASASPITRGSKILLPRSDRADERLPSALRQAGACVTEVIAYRTSAPRKVDPQILSHVKQAEVDAIIFASPSAFQNLCAFIPVAELAKLSTQVRFAAIGPTTSSAIKAAGAQVGIESADASSSALATAIADFYQRQPAAARQT